MQRILIHYLLNPLSGHMAKLSDKSRDNLFVFSGLGIFIYFLLYNARIVRIRYLFAFAVCCLFLGLMILASLSREMKPIKFRRVLAICWFGAGSLMFISGVVYNMDYLPEAVLFLVAYPILYICWNQGDPSRIFRLLLKICRLSSIVFLVISFLFAQISTVRYGGIFENVNNCANYLSLVCVCLLLEMAYEKSFNRRVIINIILFGLCEAIINYTNSRSGQLALLCAAAAGSVMFLLAHGLKDNLQYLLKVGACVAASAVMIFCLLYVLQFRQYLPIPYYSNVSHGMYFTPHWTQLVDKFTPDATSPTSPGDVTELTVPSEETIPSEETSPSEVTMPTDPAFFGHESFEELSNVKNDTTGKNMDQISTGRLSIWMAYLQKLTPFGVAQKEPVYIDLLYKNINTTHMTILEIAYESGWIAGILYFLVNVISGFMSIWYAWVHRKEPYALMPLMVILTFGVDSVLRTTNISFHYMTTFYYYLMLFPLFARPKSSRE